MTGDSRTDSVNRALQVYAFLMQQQKLGKKLLMANEDGSAEVFWIL